MAHESGKIVNLTIRVDSGILLLAKHRALLERTSVNHFLADRLEDYADGTMDVARRSNKVVFVWGIVQEVRAMRRHEKARRREERRRLVVHEPSEAEAAPYPTTDEGASTDEVGRSGHGVGIRHSADSTTTRVHECTAVGQVLDGGNARRIWGLSRPQEARRGDRLALRGPGGAGASRYAWSRVPTSGTASSRSR